MQAGTDTGGARAIATIGTLFFIIGFVTWLNRPLIGFVQLAFTLSDVGALLIPPVFHLSYPFFSRPASWIMNRIGMKRRLALRPMVMAVGTALFGQFAAVLTPVVLGAGKSFPTAAMLRRHAPMPAARCRRRRICDPACPACSSMSASR